MTGLQVSCGCVLNAKCSRCCGARTCLDPLRHFASLYVAGFVPCAKHGLISEARWEYERWRRAVRATCPLAVVPYASGQDFDEVPFSILGEYQQEMAALHRLVYGVDAVPP